ncbi:MAG TPA: VOC family protein [Stellaceae bacterium]|nr:VOC family protein [Stellaceae bacterium]
MAKLRHIAIATKDPVKTAEFYKKAFDFKEIARTPMGNPLADGVFLSDGTINLAILNFKTDQLGKGMDFTGVHHFGVLVEDADQAMAKLEALGGECFMKPEPHERMGYFEIKFRGPDGTVFDIAEHPWGGSAPLDSETARIREREPQAAK